MITLYKNPSHTGDKYDVITRGIAYFYLEYPDPYSQNAKYNIYLVYNVRPKNKPNIVRNYIARYRIGDLKGTKGNKLYPEYTLKFNTCNTNKATKDCKLVGMDIVYAPIFNDEFSFVDNNNKYSYIYGETLIED